MLLRPHSLLGPATTRLLTGLLTGLLGAAWVVAPVGCSKARPVAADSPTPDDFALSITLDQTGPGGAAWYVVDADGALRVATGTRLDRSPVPPFVRQLTAAEIAGLWDLAHRSGLESAVRASPAVDEARPRPGATVFLVADHARRAAALPADDPRLAATVVELRRLAWMESLPASQP